MNKENDSQIVEQSQIMFSPAAREALYEGLKIAADAVACTMGPRGKTVLIQRKGASPIVTKDGVTVSKAVNLKDPIKRMGAELIREAASRTNDVAGDGTTTATVLTNALVAGGIKLAAAGYPTNKLTLGIEIAVERVIKNLKGQAKNITTTSEVSQIGTISANGDKKIGNLLAEAMEKVGRDGIITVEDAKGMATTLDLVEGMQFERGYLSPYFVTNNEKMCSAYQDALVLVTDKKITSLKELIPILEEVQRTRQPLLIIADEVEAEALQGLVLNRVKANLPIVAIKAPGYGQHRGQYLSDICVLTGAALVSSNTGLSLDKTKLQHLGKTKRIVVDAKITTIVGTGATTDAVSSHVNELRSQLRDITLNVDDTSILKARIARLASGVAVIKVGGSTEIEMVERKYRIEDALHATRAAVEEGIVAGGGSALIRAANSIDFSDVTDPQILAGINVVKEACYAPLRQIVTNAAGSPDVILARFEERLHAKNIGYNAATGEFSDMLEVGVIDPVKVTRCALQHAASVAITFLALDAVIYEDL